VKLLQRPAGEQPLSGGLALRLARVKRYRDDKRPKTHTMESVRRVYAAQSARDCPPGW